MPPLTEDLEGELREHVVSSEALRGNPLGDPHELDELLIETYGYAAAYLSDEDGTVHVPFDPVTGGLVPGGVGPMAIEWLTGRLTGEDR
ncbi:hypothetical protein LUW76_43650 [Actinomadura madurae]|uniref:hypothetical protein n=1 Tax=Actinomadura madurae TaxID=1993 RepID=UPI002026520D|nr:hypothetical protein [Actinomadura madurae]URN00651.1 hypothetical protein LUW76_43650 [Actinomadura madurae]URN02800.1 hypothetical protein LUW74_05155 [Actinomadura madurae]